MHYIRFLKSPKLVRGICTAKITVTTDLGEAFLTADVVILVGLEDQYGKKVERHSRKFEWKGRSGMRSLEVGIPIPSTGSNIHTVNMVIRPDGEEFHVENLEKVLGYKNESVADCGGLIMSVRSMDINLKIGVASGSGMAERVIVDTFKDKETRVHIWEETGESIARHIWDAGLVLSAYISTVSKVHLRQPPTQPSTRLPYLEALLHQPNLEILELGAGCGIVGTTLASLIPTVSKMLLTDLDEASEILERNLSPAVFNSPRGDLLDIKHQVLDWADPLPANVAEARWDMVVVADCTYNPDVVPDLVATLKSISRLNEDLVVLLAMKVRHDSELIFFDLMKEEGFAVREKCVFPLPIIGVEDEEIEVFVFVPSRPVEGA